MTNITTFLFFCIATVGLTSIIVNGEIFAPVRDWFAHQTEEIRRRRQKNAQHASSLTELVSEILHCRHCCGFWSGLFCGTILMDTSFPNSPLRFIATVFCCGAAGSILSLGVMLLIDCLHVHTVRFQNSDPHTDHNESGG